MFRPRIIPVLLLKNNGLVKTINFNNPRYIGDPINAVKIFNDLEADELVFLDIMATMNNNINIDLISKISDEAFMPFSVGGGIRSIKSIRSLINAGAEKVVINSALFNNKNFIIDAVNEFGGQSIVASVDVKTNIFGKRNIYSNSGKKKEKISLNSFLEMIKELGVGELIINSINNDGKMQGYDIDLIQLVSSRLDIPIVACGGAGSLHDLKSAINSGGASATGCGSLFVYHGTRNAILINYPNNDELNNIFE